MEPKNADKEKSYKTRAQLAPKQNETEQLLLEERFRLTAVLEGTNVGTWEWNVETGETRVNEKWAEMLGYTLEELTPFCMDTWESLTHPEDFAQAMECIQKHFRGERKYYQHAFRMRHKNGGWVWVLDRGKVAKWSADGKPLLMFGTHQDITEQKRTEESLKQALEEKEFLMREIHHRVKNNLAMVASLISLKESSLGFTVDLSDLVHQINAIGMIHEKLYSSESFTHINLLDYIHELLDAVFSISEQPVDLDIQMEPLLLSARKALYLGLVINEIATNALKHGFPGIDKPSFRVRADYSSVENSFFLTLGNNGAPFPEDVALDNSETLGLRLICILMEQLEGKVELARAPHPVFNLRFPGDDL